jgi:predicted HTH domain antitoxin
MAESALRGESLCSRLNLSSRINLRSHGRGYGPRSRALRGISRRGFRLCVGLGLTLIGRLLRGDETRSDEGGHGYPKSLFHPLTNTVEIGRRMQIGQADDVDSNWNFSYRVRVEMVSLNVPADLVKAAKLESGDPSLEAAKLLALELFRENKVSLGRAAELCGTPLEAFMEFACRHEVSPLRYGERELEEDHRTLADLGL